MRAVAGAVAALLLSPSPSPSLDSVLAAAPSGYLPNMQISTPTQGSFEAVDYVATLSASKPSQTLRTLDRDGFVAGYGRFWADSTSEHILGELVIAFAGGAGAKAWLPEARALLQNADGQYWKHEIPVAGIDLEYGSHFANSKAPVYIDVVGFVKGNDFYIVEFLSAKDDLGDLAANQAQRLYQAAPPNTIPPARWPENGAQTSPISLATGFAPFVIGFVVVAALLLVGVVVALVARRRSPRPAGAVAGGPQMSPDGNYWWDGQTWRDASQSAPPSAQRSVDGRYWWDGGKWRTIPSPPPPVS